MGLPDGLQNLVDLLVAERAVRHAVEQERQLAREPLVRQHLGRDRAVRDVSHVVHKEMFLTIHVELQCRHVGNEPLARRRGLQAALDLAVVARLDADEGGELALADLKVEPARLYVVSEGVFHASPVVRTVPHL